VALLGLITDEPEMAHALDEARRDLASVTRAARIEIASAIPAPAGSELAELGDAGGVGVCIVPEAGV
jgi:hypothetical protein